MAMLSRASCLRDTRHMWQLQPPTGQLGSCKRSSTLRPEFEGNRATVAEAVAAALDNALNLGDLAYKCTDIKHKQELQEQRQANVSDQQIKMNKTEQIHHLSN
ncbi:Hypothetical predicted protein [Drosophila guanche]|nr:Hypothetical predicted protein [Drosophila guanche]